MKKVILWNYERGTWQYDVFCLLIIAFIFLTPKTWFAGKEKDATPKALSTVKVEDFPNGVSITGNSIKELGDKRNTDILEQNN